MLRRLISACAVSAGVMLVLASSLAAARGLAEVPPKGVDLNGTWTLNTALSDDPREILEAERAKRRGRHREPPPPMTGAGTDARPSQNPTQRRTRREDGDEIDMPAHLTISHRADRFVVSSPAPSNEIRKSEYRAGSRSVVSVANGVADREVGWKGKTFIISTRAVEGVRREDRYFLDKEGRLLVVTATRGGDVPSREVKRVYEKQASWSRPAQQPADDSRL